MICAACGTVNAPEARFCAACGARLVADDLPTVGPDPRSAALPPPPTRGSGRGRDIALWTAVALVGIAIIVAIIVAFQSSDDGSNPAAPAETTQPAPDTTVAITTNLAPSVPTTPLTRATPPTALLGQQAMLEELAGIMTDSEAGRTIVYNTMSLGIFAGCSISAADAARNLDGAIANRQELVTRLDELDARVESPRLVRLLREALDLSLRADRRFQQWLLENAADPSVPCDRETPTKIAADDLSDRSTLAKKDFLREYNEQAGRAGLRNDWTEDDF
jgi:hypothetical protein